VLQWYAPIDTLLYEMDRNDVDRDRDGELHVGVDVVFGERVFVPVV